MGYEASESEHVETAPAEPAECDASCGKEAAGDELNNVRADGSWTCPACRGVAARENVVDFRNGR
jgi:hypothetical protein